MVQPVAIRRSAPTISAVSRAMAVIERLAGLAEGGTVSELSQSLQIEISVVSRLLSSLEADGYVRRSSVSPDRYMLGWRLAAITYRFVDALTLPEIALPALRDLASEVNELVQLAVVDGMRVRFVAKADADQRVTLRGLVGRSANPDTTATGKAWLAFLNDDDRRNVLATSAGDVPSRSRPPLDDLLRDLAEVRKRGFALETQSNTEEVMAIAVPVWAGTPERVVAVVTLSGPAYRLEPEQLIAMAPALQRTSAILSGIWPALLLKEHVGSGKRDIVADS
ncbi:MAG: IclR family transcriptional regulator [Sphingobium sp.]